MDPALMGLSEGSSLYSELTYDKGTVLWYDGALTPWALESWKSNDDSTQYTFKVRQGINFHHGKEMKAEDVKFTYDRILDPATASPLEAQLNFISTITAVDDYTLEFDLDGGGRGSRLDHLDRMIRTAVGCDCRPTAPSTKSSAVGLPPDCRATPRMLRP
ncbi:MAG: hypothetical protein IH986_11610 [Planctomycetes bacterium]|nr:hypothetical protein [Planctomycetota bacterium]